MALRRWVGNAKDVKGVWTITIGGTWVTGNTITITIGDVSVVATVGANVSTTQVATLLKEAINNGTLSDATASVSPAGGGSALGEFYGLSATSSMAVVTITGTAGILFQMTSAKTSAAGTIAPEGAVTAVTSPTGKQFWDNVQNWEQDAVPVDGDDLVYDQGNVSCRFNIDTAIQPASITVTKDYTGHIGLREVNQDNQSLKFREYRQKSLKFSSNAITTAIYLGEGTGSGSSLIRLDLNDCDWTAVVYGSGTGIDNQPAILITDDASNTTNTLTVNDGHVGLAYYDGTTGRVASLVVGKSAQNAKVEIGRDATLTSAVLSIAGGTTNIWTTTVGSASLTQTGGTVITEGGSWATYLVWGGTNVPGAITVATTFELGAGVLDCETDLRPKTITPLAQLHKGAKIADRNGRVTFTTGYKTVGCSAKDVDLQLGFNRTYTVA